MYFDLSVLFIICIMLHLDQCPSLYINLKFATFRVFTFRAQFFLILFRLQCLRKLDEETLNSDLLSSLPTYKEKLRAFYYAWNPDDCSRNIYVKRDGFTLHRRSFIRHSISISEYVKKIKYFESVSFLTSSFLITFFRSEKMLLWILLTLPKNRPAQHMALTTRQKI